METRHKTSNKVGSLYLIDSNMMIWVATSVLMVPDTCTGKHERARQCVADAERTSAYSNVKEHIGSKRNAGGRSNLPARHGHFGKRIRFDPLYHSWNGNRRYKRARASEVKQAQSCLKV